jgi:hypothetical protein
MSGGGGAKGGVASSLHGTRDNSQDQGSELSNSTMIPQMTVVAASGMHILGLGPSATRRPATAQHSRASSIAKPKVAPPDSTVPNLRDQHTALLGQGGAGP